jgi:hypothetical protein
MADIRSFFPVVVSSSDTPRNQSLIILQATSSSDIKKDSLMPIKKALIQPDISRYFSPVDKGPAQDSPAPTQKTLVQSDIFKYFGPVDKDRRQHPVVKVEVTEE